MFLFRFFGLSLKPTSHLFSKPVLKATSFIEKCLFHFHTDLPRGGSDICRKPSPTMYSLLPHHIPRPPSPVPHPPSPSSSPYPSLPGRDLDLPETRELMSPFDHWLPINITVLGAILFYQLIHSSLMSCYDQVPTSA